MGRIIQYMIIALATLTAFVFLFFGIKRIKIQNNKSHSFFITSLLLALSLFGYDASLAAEEENAPQQAAVKENRPKSARIEELNKTQEWKNFKAFWRRLDQVEPKKSEKENTNDYFKARREKYEYTHSIEINDAERFRTELAVLTNSLKNLEKDKKITEEEIELLKRVCNERIDYMSGKLLGRIMLSRAIPPPSRLQEDESIIDLEKKIDTLNELKKKGKIDTEESKQALAKIRDDIEILARLDKKGIERFSSLSKPDSFFFSLNELIKDLVKDE